MDTKIIISNKTVMDAIHKAVADEDVSMNLIETEELRMMYDKFIEKYTDENDIDGTNEFWEDLNDVLFSFERRSFDVGFKTAVSLVTGADLPIERGNI